MFLSLYFLGYIWNNITEIVNRDKEKQESILPLFLIVKIGNMNIKKKNIFFDIFFCYIQIYLKIKLSDHKFLIF